MKALRRAAIVASLAVIGVIAPLQVQGDGYPARPVKFINPAAAGSATDVVGRLVADQLAKRWAQAVITENRPGAGGVVAAQSAAQAAADGYTLFFAAASSFVIAPHLHRSLPYEPDRDFVPVGFVTEIPLVIAVRASLPAQSLQDLLALASRTPGAIEYAANAPGSFPHLAGELFARRAGVKLTFVPYKGAAAALQDIAGGRIAMIVEGVSGISGALQSGQLRALAVTSDKRLPDLPDLPAVSESLPGFTAVGWFAMFAPAKSPLAVIEKVHTDLRTVLAQADVIARLQALGSYPRYMTREQLAEYVRSERALWGSIVRQLDLKTQ
jgi:tripartite-type tricarboxylate transporter receptor subunit TctC